MNKQKRPFVTTFPWQRWEGLSGWNYYFLLKFGLLWSGYLNFHALANLVFACVLIYPITLPKLRKFRSLLMFPIGIGLFYHDTWLPGIKSIQAQGSEVFGFSLDYLIELTQRFINWNMIAAAFVLLVLFKFLKEWIRITPFSMTGLLLLTLQPYLNIQLSVAAPTTSTSMNSKTKISGTTNSTVASIQNNATVDNQTLNTYITDFYNKEKSRQVSFPQSLPANSEPFDVLLINICLLAWDDIDMIHLMDHPLWKHFDILFKNFNSSTGYSGPASIRLLRASCGQPSNADLFKPADPHCYLFENLKALGFNQEVALDHTGVYGNYLQELRDGAALKQPLMSQQGLTVTYNGFDGSPIYDDGELFKRWLRNRTVSDAEKSVTFFNLITLHDGNHLLGKTESAPYGDRAKKLFDQLDEFLSNLEKSGKRYMVVVVPEHGAALRGDKLQMSGLRDIPMPYITHVPVGIQFINMKATTTHQTNEIDQPSSFLALSELISRSLKNNIFGTDTVDWTALTNQLPETASVSENEGSRVVQYQGKTYIQLNEGDWIPE